MKSNSDDRHDNDGDCEKETPPKTRNEKELKEIKISGLHEGKLPKSLCQMENMQSYLRGD